MNHSVAFSSQSINTMMSIRRAEKIFIHFPFSFFSDSQTPLPARKTFCGRSFEYAPNTVSKIKTSIYLYHDTIKAPPHQSLHTRALISSLFICIDFRWIFHDERRIRGVAEDVKHMWVKSGAKVIVFGVWILSSNAIYIHLLLSGGKKSPIMS